MSKRILIIGDFSINNNDAVGITLRSFFQSPRYEILNYYRIEKQINNDEGFLSEKIPEDVIPLDNSFRKIKKQINYTETNIANNVVESSNSTKMTSRIKFLTENFINIKNLYQVVEQFEPDYIYTIGGSLSSLKISYILSKKTQTPLIIHFMDNWVETLYAKNYWINKWWRKFIRKIVSHSKKCIVISPKMFMEYSKFIDKGKISLLMNIPSEYSLAINGNKGNNLNVSYIGGLHLKRWEKLLELSKIIKKSNLNIIVNIYTNSNLSTDIIDKFDTTIVKFKKSLPHDELKKAYDNSDVLLHVESDDKDIINYTKYSFSTKISEYLYSGLPILYFGPKNLAVPEYLEENEIGLVSADQDEVTQKFNWLFSVTNRKRLGEKAKKHARNYHSREYQEGVMYEIFR